MIKVYKLLRLYPDGRLYSWVARGVHRLEYKTDELILHPNMFVFQQREVAKDWRAEEIVVWECETSQVKPVPEFVLHNDLLNQFFDDYWEGVSRGVHLYIHRVVSTPPAGTVLVDDLRLIKEVR